MIGPDKPGSILARLRRLPWHCITLFALTLFAAIFRFGWINRPAMWNDEAHVFRRITGTYQDLLDQLQVDGFGPIHYQIYWGIAHWNPPSLGQFIGKLFHLNLHVTDFFADNSTTLLPARMNAFWMRLIPSLAGTLMVPAMYFLARQLCSRRTSLLAAAFAACSAYLMVFSHDSKMYMDLWLCCTLNMACLLCWLRTGRRIAWLGWIAAGLAMAGLHAPGMLLLALQPLFLLSGRGPRWDRLVLVMKGQARAADFARELLVPAKRVALFLLGIGIIASGPAVHYLKFNRFIDRVDENWGSAGLGWVPGVLHDRSGPEMVRFATSAYLYSWEWPKSSYDDVREAARPDPANAKATQQYMAIAMSGSQPAMLQGTHIDPSVMSGLMAAVVIILGLAAIGLFPWSRLLRGQRDTDPPTEPFWRTSLWLGMWILLPAYGFYYANNIGQQRLDKTIELQRQGKVVTPQSVEKMIELRPPASPADWRHAVGATLRPVLAHPFTVLASYGDLRGSQWLALLAILLLLAGVVVAWIYLPHLWRMLIVQVCIAGVLLVLAWPMLFAPSALPADWWMIPRKMGDGWLTFISDPRTILPAAILIPPLAWWFAGSTPVQRTTRLFQFLAVVITLYLLCLGVNKYLTSHPPGNDGPVWIPRYIGIIWPAFAIAVCALIMRLPTPLLRALAICVLLGVNIAQASGRMFLGSEPRVDLMMRDIVAADRADSPILTYIQDGPETAHPGGGTPENRAGKYYVAVTTGRLFQNRVPAYFLSNAGQSAELLNLRQIRGFSVEGEILPDARRPNVQHLIVWDRLLTRPSAEESDSLAAALGPQWKWISTEIYPVRYHWNWSELYLSRRREYVRVTASP